MQAAMDITAKYCHKEMEAYGSCVASNPSTWQQTCHELKMKVAQCTSSHPVIQKIRQGCSSEFMEFERCLRENQNNPTSCSTHVARFLGCAETVDLSGVGAKGPWLRVHVHVANVSMLEPPITACPLHHSPLLHTVSPVEELAAALETHLQSAATATRKPASANPSFRGPDSHNSPRISKLYVASITQVGPGVAIGHQPAVTACTGKFALAEILPLQLLTEGLSPKLLPSVLLAKQSTVVVSEAEAL